MAGVVHGEETTMKIFVENLSHAVTEADLRKTFEAFGEVASAAVLKDKFTGEPRGFGFVEMPVQATAQSAIAGLNGKALMGRALNVNAARPRPDHGGGGGQVPFLIARVRVKSFRMRGCRCGPG